MKKKPTGKLSVKEKVALAVFMEAVPSIIRIWKAHAPELPFDEFCLREYEKGKSVKKSK